MDLCQQSDVSDFNILSRFVIAFLDQASFNFMAAITICSDFEAQENSFTVTIFSPSIGHEVMGLEAMFLVFWMLDCKPAFSLCFTFIKSLFSFYSLFAIKVISYAYLRFIDISPSNLLIPACDSSRLAFRMVHLLCLFSNTYACFPGGTSGKESACQCRRCQRCGFDTWVRKIPWRRACQPTPVFLLGNPMDRGAWWATGHGVIPSWTWLSTYFPKRFI